jgi:hypothetical protein
MTYRRLSGTEKTVLLAGVLLGADLLSAILYAVGVRFEPLSYPTLVNVILAAASVTMLCYVGVTWQDG